jgi:hypothetical protein
MVSFQRCQRKDKFNALITFDLSFHIFTIFSADLLQLMHVSKNKFLQNLFRKAL